MVDYVELHCHSYFSFHDGASSLEDLLLRARDLGYPALAITDHDNLCGAMRFAQSAPNWGVKAITGAEVTLRGGYHLTLLAASVQGYHKLCRLLSFAHVDNPRDEPQADLSLLVRPVEGRVTQASTTPHPVDHPDDVVAGGSAGQVPRTLLALFHEIPGGHGSPLLRHAGSAGILPARPNVAEGFSLRVPRDNHDVSPPRGYAQPEGCGYIFDAGGSPALPGTGGQDARAPGGVAFGHTSPCEGLIALSGCSRGEIPTLLMEGRWDDARAAARRYRELFGENFYLELQNNLCYGDRERNRRLVALGREMGIPLVATNNVHYHLRERHQLQDALVAIRHCKTLEETHRERRPNSEFYLKSPSEMAALFAGLPEALANTVRIAEQCSFDLRRDLDYRFPECPVPEGHTEDSYLEQLCYEAAKRRYGEITPKCRARLEEELRLIRKHRLSGFFLIYHEILKLGREVALELGIGAPNRRLEEEPPGRSRGSSVALLVGYLIGLSHIDPLKYDLSLERFLHEDLSSVPDVDLDFSRDIREGLIKRVHEKWGWQHAVLVGMFDTYQVKGAVRDLGKALGLPAEEIDKLAKRLEHSSAADLPREMERLPEFAGKVNAPVWRDLVRLAAQIDGFPKFLAQHPGGMVISSQPIIEMVPVQRGAIEGRYICQWDKDDVDDAKFIKIDFLALGALSQMQEAIDLIEARHGRRIDLSRIDHEDPEVYRALGEADTIGVFQVESAAQMQTIVRMRPQNLVDMAIEVALVRPGVGASDSTHMYIARRMGKEPVVYDHPLVRRALERTLGAIVFQDQVNQLAIDVAGFSSWEADKLRRAFGRRDNRHLVDALWEKFRDGALSRGVPEEVARKIFLRFNGQYMFPESHAYAFGVTAYQSAWLKRYYPLEFYVGIFNQQPMGFYNLETLKEDARRHGVKVLNPDINLSREKCTIHEECLLLGFLQVDGVGEVAARRLVEERDRNGPYTSLADLMERTGLWMEVYDNLADAGAFDALGADRRIMRWEVGLRYRPARVGKGTARKVASGLVPGDASRHVASGLVPSEAPRRVASGLVPDETQQSYKERQLSLTLPVEQDMAPLPPQSLRERMVGEYRTLNLYPGGHLMAHLRPQLPLGVLSSEDVSRMEDGQRVQVAGLIIRRQRPHPRSGVVFLTLEDEFGHIPLIIWPQMYERYRAQFRFPVVLVTGIVSRRDGTMNVVVQRVEASSEVEYAPPSKNWC